MNRPSLPLEHGEGSAGVSATARIPSPAAPLSEATPACALCGYSETTHALNEAQTSVMCDAKIRPFPGPTEITCESSGEPHDEHRAVLRDYAYPGSETVLTWKESDRRTFRGLFIPCGDNHAPCVLPWKHRGRHAPVLPWKHRGRHAP